MNALSVGILGFLLGLRHATDADHVVAVTTIVTRERTFARAAWIGGLWGIGHSLTVLVVGGALVAFRLVIPPRLGLGLEFAVALMLILLGFSNLRPASAGAPKAHPHEHPPRLSGWRPVLVGIVHGLAGSAAYLDRVEMLVTEMLRDDGVRLPGARREQLRRSAQEHGLTVPDSVLKQLAPE